VNKKLVSVSVILSCAFAITVAIVSQVQAKVKYTLIKDSSGILYRYDYVALKTAYAMDKPLYTDYTSRLTSNGPLAYYDDVNNFYVLAKDVKLAYVTQPGEFSMDDYVSSSKAKNANIVDQIKQVSTDSSGNVVVTDANDGVSVVHTTAVKPSIEVGKKIMIVVTLTNTSDYGKYDIYYGDQKLTKLDTGVYSIDIAEDLTAVEADAKLTFKSTTTDDSEDFDLEAIY
jgi:hypothetical protein